MPSAPNGLGLDPSLEIFSDALGTQPQDRRDSDAIPMVPLSFHPQNGATHEKRVSNRSSTLSSYYNFDEFYDVEPYGDENHSRAYLEPSHTYNSSPAAYHDQRIANLGTPREYYGSSRKMHGISDEATHTPHTAARKRRARKSVPIDSLDPTGVQELSRRLSRRTQMDGPNPAHRSITIEPIASDEKENSETFESSTVDPFDENNKFDLGRLLREAYAESDRRGNMRRIMGIAFRDFGVTGFGSGAELNQTFGSVMLSPLRIVSSIRSMFHRVVKHIIRDSEGCVKPGEMLLVLGRPGSGCTTMLKALCSYRDGFRSIDGTVLYEGLDHKSIDGPLRGDVVYSPEDDIHFPTLTVGQTLAFATATRAPSTKYRMTLTDDQGRKEYIELTREVLATILGLRHTYNTKVGNDMVRGVSGGERKRVSIAETLAARAKIVMFDNSSRGLDSSTALEFVTALRVSTNISMSTTVASIYQAGENITQLFDKVCVLNQGRMVYFGPLAYAVDHFKSIGFEPLHRQTTADFLVACTDLTGQNVNPHFEGSVPRLPDEQARAFRNSPVGRANHAEVENYIAVMMSRQTKQNADFYVDLARDERAKHSRKGSKYLISWPMQVRLALKRRAQIAWGDMPTHLTVILAALFQSIIIGSVFYQMPHNSSGFFSRGGVLFFSLLYNSFTGMSEISLGYEQRPIVIRQKRFAMLHPSADALGNTLLDFPVRMISILIFDIVVYFMTGLSYTAEKFFTYFGVTSLVTYCMTAFFRMLAASTKSEPLATMFGGVAVLDVALYTGYMIPRKSMKPWWKWLSYCNPVAFGFEMLLANEYRGLEFACQQLVPFDKPGTSFDYDSPNNTPYRVCPIAGAEPGRATVNAERYLLDMYGFSWDNTNRNAGILIGFWIFFLICYLCASERQIDPAASGGMMLYNRATSKNLPSVREGKGLEDLETDPELRQANAAVENEVAPVAADAAPRHLQVSDSVFSWENLNFDVMIKGEPRRLLNNVSGFVAPGKMTALMGESGAGKTTLLNVLAQRSDVGVVHGDFFVNGRALPRSFQADTGYCQQQDVHLAQTTVREALQFSAMLRQPRETPKEERLAYVETVIELLEMQSFAEALVGEVSEGLSVEQRKRLTIGVELAAKPSLLLFLDEPTSGLDAQAAWSIVRFLKKLANEGQAILCTIHQPSGELFNQFDRLLLLQKGGKTVYFGDIGENSLKMLHYFEQRCGVKCDINANPAEYILDVIGAGATATTKHNWREYFLQSQEYKDLQQQLVIYRHSNTGGEQDQGARSQREYAQPFFVQLSQVTSRAFVAYWRNPLYLITKLILNVVSGLVVGSSFWKQGNEQTYIALQNRLFACFLALVASTSLSQHLQPEFIRFRSLFEVREKPSKLYTWPVMVLGAILVEIPWNFIGGTVYWIPWYYLIEFPTDSKRSAYSWGFYMLFQLYYCTFAQAMAAISANAMIASVLFSTFFAFVVVFCGVVQPPPLLPSFWRSWMYHVSPFFYFMEGMLGNAVGGVAVQCEPSEMQQLFPPPGMTCDQYLTEGGFTTAVNVSPAAQGIQQGYGYYTNGPSSSCLFCLYRYGDDYLATVLMDAGSKYRDLGIVIAFIAFNTALVFALFYLFRIRRWGSSKVKPVKSLTGEQHDESVAVPAMEAEAPTMTFSGPGMGAVGYGVDDKLHSMMPGRNKASDSTTNMLNSDSPYLHRGDPNDGSMFLSSPMQPTHWNTPKLPGSAHWATQTQSKQTPSMADSPEMGQGFPEHTLSTPATAHGHALTMPSSAGPTPLLPQSTLLPEAIPERRRSRRRRSLRVPRTANQDETTEARREPRGRYRNSSYSSRTLSGLSYYYDEYASDD